MTSLAQTIIPKSDQLNADDLIGRSMTIEITDVKGVAGEQPIAIHFKGDNGKPYKPCKSMRRVFVFVWGDNGKEYIGRKLTLYRDEKVKFGGIEVGGIRISHMSHIAEPIKLALTETRASRKPYVVHPLQEAGSLPNEADIEGMKIEAREAALGGTKNLQDHWKAIGAKNQKFLVEFLPEWKKLAAECDAAGGDGGQTA